MKKISIFILQLIIPAILTAAPQPDSLQFKESSAEYYSNGQLKKCKLKSTQLVQNLPCRRWLKFHENGQIRQFELAEDKVIQNIKFPAKTIMWLRPDGTIDRCWLSKSMTIQDYPCKGGSWSKIDTGFHPNGKLRLIFLDDDTIIQNIPCRASIFHPVYFYDSGRLHKCTLSQDTEINTVQYEKGDKLEFDENGNVIAK